MDQLLQNVYDTVRHEFNDPIAAGDPGTVSYLMMGKSLVNCFTISAVANGVKEAFIHKRPGIRTVTGLDLATTLGAVSAIPVANAVMTSLNDVYVAAYYDNTNVKHVIIQYRPITGTQVKIGEIAGTNAKDDLFLTELTIANVCTLGVVWNSFAGTTSKGYYATSGAAGFPAASLTEIVDVDFPPKRGTPLPLVGPMVQMNGTTYVMTNTGEIVNSDLNSITSWNSLGTIQAISYPDQGVGLCRYKHHLVAFGEDSIEFFNDVGLPAPKSPLARTEQAFIKYGALHARMISAIDDTIYFFAKSGSGTMGLHRMEGYIPVKVSTPYADNLILGSYSSVNIANNLTLSCITMLGSKHIALGGVSAVPSLQNGDTSLMFATGTLMYNITENEFWSFYTGNPTREALLAVSQYQLNNNDADTSYCLLGTAGGVATNDTRYTKVYAVVGGFSVPFVDRYGAVVGGTYTPNVNTNYLWGVQTNPLWFGTEKRKRIHRAKVIIDNSPLQSSSSAATMNIRFCKGILDTGSNATVTTRTLTFPNAQQRYYIANLGQARVFQFFVYMQNDGPVRLRALEFDISQAAS